MEKSARRALLWGKLNKSGGGHLHRSLTSSFSRLIWKCSSISLTLKSEMWTRVLPVRSWQWRLSRFNSETWKRSIVGVSRQTNRVAHSHLRNKRSSAWDGQKQTSVSSTIWFCHPSSPGDPCTSSPWGWRRGRCRCCGPRTPRGRAGQTPASGLADTVSSDGPVKREGGF